MSQQTANDALIIYPILDADVSSGAAISASKLGQHKKITSDFGLNTDDTPAATNKTVYVAQGAGTLKTFKAMCTDTGTTADVDFDLLKNGTTVLTGTVNITNAQTDNTLYAGTISSAAFVAGDVITIDLAITTTTGMLGPYCELTLDDTYIG